MFICNMPRSKVVVNKHKLAYLVDKKGFGSQVVSNSNSNRGYNKKVTKKKLYWQIYRKVINSFCGLRFASLIFNVFCTDLFLLVSGFQQKCMNVILLNATRQENHTVFTFIFNEHLLWSWGTFCKKSYFITKS